MPGIDEQRTFIPLKIAVLTVSDTRSLEEDRSGATLAERIGKAGHAVAARAIVTDDVEKIREQVQAWIADPAIDVVISTGGTGFTGRDVTPEALEPLFEKRMEGFCDTVPAGQPRQDRHLGDPDARDRRCRGRDLHLLPARLARRLPRCLGRDPRASARLPLSPLQLRRDHAAARRASAQGEGARRDRIAHVPEKWIPVRKMRQRMNSALRELLSQRPRNITDHAAKGRFSWKFN